MEHILNEARELAESGVRELILVAQDLTRYGLDLYNERKLPELLERLCQIEKLAWIRLHYLYPEEVTDELISTIRNQPNPGTGYPDTAHSDGILRRTNRRSDGQKIRTLIESCAVKSKGMYTDEHNRRLSRRG